MTSLKHANALALAIVIFVVAAATFVARPAAAANVLALMPHHGYSHFKVFFPLLYGLAERGHKVTVITYVKSTQPAHVNYEELLLKGENTVHDAALERFPKTRSLQTMWREFFALHQGGQHSCEKFYNSGYVDVILKRHAAKPYNLVIQELFNTDCYLGLPYLLQVPVIGLSSCALMPWYYDRIALPNVPAHVQSEFIGFPEVLNWRQRCLNFVQFQLTKFLYRFYTQKSDRKFIQKYLHVDVDVEEFAKSSIALIFVNQHYALSGNRPFTPQYIEMGGIHVEEQKINETLSTDLQQFLAQSKQDVLFISWGSNLRSSTLEKRKFESIVKALQALPLRIIWKWEGAVPKTLKSNRFLFTKWAPQLALLCHPKVKYFWGHGGLLGTTEAVYCGKPLILTPIYGDQFTNAYAVENRKVGKILPYEQLETESLKKTLQEVMKSRYSLAAAKLSQVFRQRESPPLHTCVWWVEHVLQHGEYAKQLLQTKAVSLNWFIYYSLDTILLLLIGMAISLWTLLKLLRMSIALVQRLQAKQKRKHKRS